MNKNCYIKLFFLCTALCCICGAQAMDPRDTGKAPMTAQQRQAMADETLFGTIRRFRPEEELEDVLERDSFSQETLSQALALAIMVKYKPAISVLLTRRTPVTDEVRQAIEACDSTAILETLERAGIDTRALPTMPLSTFANTTKLFFLAVINDNVAEIMNFLSNSQITKEVQAIAFCLATSQGSHAAVDILSNNQQNAVNFCNALPRRLAIKNGFFGIAASCTKHASPAEDYDNGNAAYDRTIFSAVLDNDADVLAALAFGEPIAQETLDVALCLAATQGFQDAANAIIDLGAKIHKTNPTASALALASGNVALARQLTPTEKASIPDLPSKNMSIEDWINESTTAQSEPITDDAVCEPSIFRHRKTFLPSRRRCTIVGPECNDDKTPSALPALPHRELDALTQAVKDGRGAIVKELLTHFCTPQQTLDDLLDLAFRTNKMDIVEVLVEHGADVNGANGRLLKHAAKQGDFAKMRQLMGLNANIETPGVLWTAVVYRKREVALFILAVAPNHPDRDRALLTAIQQHDDELANVLRTKGANAETVGFAEMLKAIETENIPYLEQLLAVPEITTPENMQIASELAAMGENAAIIQLLKNHPISLM